MRGKELELSWEGIRMGKGSLDVSVIVPALHEGPNLAVLLPRINQVLDGLGVVYETIVVTKEADDDTTDACEVAGSFLIEQSLPGYGGALIEGFRAAKGQYILTMDADLSHRPDFIEILWEHRDSAEVSVASRYVAGGAAHMPLTRTILSRALNVGFRHAIAMPIKDLSSGFRLYRATALPVENLRGHDFDLLEEILIKMYCEGWRVQEVPFEYMPRSSGQSTARTVRVGRAYLRSFVPLWKLRNSIEAADYDARAYDSVIPLQRYWQRERFRIVTELIEGEGPVLDVGCGSSRILEALPSGSVGVDVLVRKLRYVYSAGETPVVLGSGFALPFADGAFPCVLSSQVIEHVPKDSPMLDELCRVVGPGGRLVLGTPDYARWEWVYLEKLYARLAPWGYADEHIAHYSERELVGLLEARGFVHEASRYILRGELIMAFRRKKGMSENQTASA